MKIDITLTRLPVGFLAMTLVLCSFIGFDCALSAAAETAQEVQPIDPKADAESDRPSRSETAPQKQPPPEPQTATASEADQKTDSTAQPADTVGDRTPDIFVPSEDISEDLAVAFPVDI